jgi:protein-disulfide isomerase/uncharacterized membrane protein
MAQQRTRPNTSTATGPAVSPALLAAGTVFAAFAAFMSVLLVIKHIHGMELPGCREGGACDEVTTGPWGSIPGLNWPVAFFGFSYFLALATGWLISGGRLPALAKNVVRLGMLGSLLFMAIMVLKGTYCQYCIGAHLGNAAFWLVMEFTRARNLNLGGILGSAAAVFLVSSVGLGVWNAQAHAAFTEKSEAELDQATREIIERSLRPDPGDPPPAVVTPGNPTPQPRGEGTPAPRDATPDRVSLDESPVGERFEGRYRWGPEKAPIRIMMYTSYQCPDCYRIEHDLQELMETRDDIAVSVKYFPFNSDCNDHIERTTQPNACWAARAAEAAGMMYGTETFWKMHQWLFERRGGFSKAEDIVNAIREFGHDPTGYIETVTSEETLRRVKADADEAKALGLYFTPMIFINGVELKGWHLHRALQRTVEKVAATNPPARTSAYDRPPMAFEKYIADWRENDRIAMPPDVNVRALGPDDAAVRIVIWGDYEEEFTAEADAIARGFAAERDDVRYEFRHNPFNSECNPLLDEPRHPYACKAHQSAEAAFLLGGHEAFWKVHSWLMEHHDALSDEALRAALPELGLDPDQLFTLRDDERAVAAVKEDLDAGQKLPRLRLGTKPGIRGIPAVFVNERYIPRWRLEGHDVMSAVIEEAAAGK